MDEERCRGCGLPEDDCECAEHSICSTCNGSGEGMYEGSTCRTCGGSGNDAMPWGSRHNQEED